MKNNELGIYIHIPFCKSKCNYCDFVSYANKENIESEYIEAVKKEINRYDLKKYDVTTIYFGGGTPSYIDSKYIVDIMDILNEKLKDNKTDFDQIEITLEVNPGTTNKENLKKYFDSHINRLSIGLQSANNQILKQIGRIHTYEEFLETYNNAREVGFKNINVDLMIGLPNQRIRDVKDSLNKIIKLNPEHVSVYSLIIEEGTKLEEQIRNNELKEIDEDLERDMYWYVKNTLELNGYIHYEISNFSKEKMQSKHNLNCWEQKEYIGIGVAAHSYLNNVRYSNCNSIEEYIKNIDIQNYNIDEEQELEDKKMEYMLLGLRKIDGVSISEFKRKYTENPLYVFRNELNELVNEGLINIDGDKIRLTNKGIDFGNLVWEKFVKST